MSFLERFPAICCLCLGFGVACADSNGATDGATTDEATTSPTTETTAGPDTATSPTASPTTDEATTEATTQDATQTDSSSDSEASSDTDSDTDTTGEELVCNGHSELCSRPYNEVVFPCTHNAHSATSEGYTLNANHRKGVPEQLEAGIRAMMLDVYLEDDVTTLCHGPCGLGSQPHIEVVEALHDFLVANPGEVITIIYQDDVPPSAIEADFVATGLVDYVYTHTSGDPWPTLGEMVEADTRLVITAESGSPPPDWYHHAWDLIWDTPYSHKSVDDFSCELNRGSLSNDLFLINHWVNNILDLPSEPDAMIVNAYDVLHDRATECLGETGRLPNFIGIDFYQQGDLIAVVDDLNGV